MSGAYRNCTADLEQSPVVANCRMNRERGLAGVNSYAKDLGFHPARFLEQRLSRQPIVRWLDLCCGQGRALLEAAQYFDKAGFGDRVDLTGIDLVGMFLPELGGGGGDGGDGLRGSDSSRLRPTLIEGSVFGYDPPAPLDLITCVHGLHYLGDKLELLRKAAAWLSADGLFLAHADLHNIRIEGHTPSNRLLLKTLRAAGFEWQPRRHLLTRRGRGDVTFPLHYLGPDDTAGPNYTGQPAVDSWYAPT